MRRVLDKMGNYIYIWACRLLFNGGNSILKSIDDMNLNSHIEKGIIIVMKPFPMCEFFV
ncbi:hypothetical protein J2T15_005359 [Paenibacillus harenae]|uniref:Uncharacterized protein n=1 Tax=Paenibacillus harenae TaxID=306543 RepID=A0ABT9U8E2_PAEHA|nr:hypothetical protein [Paenibacillus harenae]